MKELAIIQSELKAPKRQYNAFGKYKYRSCEDILEAVKPLLARNGCTLTLSDDIVEVGGRIYVKATCEIRNGGGESVRTVAFAREETDKKGMDAAQMTGSASSYARKYALNGLFCIDDNKDADAAQAQRQAPQAAVTPPKEILDLADMVRGDIAIAPGKEAVKRIWTERCEAFRPYAALRAEIKRLVIEKGKSFSD